MKILPKGLKFLQGERQTEEVTMKCLEECCINHPRCRDRKECHRLYAMRSGNDPRYGGWGWPYKTIYRVPRPKPQTDIEKYCNYLPTISSNILRERTRESVSGGMI